MPCSTHQQHHRPYVREDDLHVRDARSINYENHCTHYFSTGDKRMRGNAFECEFVRISLAVDPCGVRHRTVPYYGKWQSRYSLWPTLPPVAIGSAANRTELQPYRTSTVSQDSAECLNKACA